MYGAQRSFSLCGLAITRLKDSSRRVIGCVRMNSRDPTDGVYHPPDDMEPPLPEYQPRRGETTEVQKARLLYQSRKRGIKENDLLLSSFAAKYLEDMTEKQLELYDTLINRPTNDWDIYYWATGKKPIPEEYQSEVMDMLKTHTSNENMESRLRQPDL